MCAPDADLKQWRRLLAPYQRPDWWLAGRELLVTVALLVGSLLLVWRSLEGPSALTLLLTVPVSVCLLRLFVIQHDCGHGAFLPSRRANDLLGGLLGIVTLAPYTYWRHNHALHHAHHGNLDRSQLGGLETLTVAAYQNLTPARKLAYRLYRHPLVLMGVGPLYQLGLKHRFPYDIPRSWRREWRSVVLNNLALVGLLWLAEQAVGVGMVLRIYLPAIFVTWSAGIWLFFVQHQFEHAYWRHEADWRFTEAALVGSSFYDLPEPLAWLTGYIGYHHLHHLSTQVPLYRLKACHRAIPALQQAPRFTFRQSLACARLRLWNETEQRLVSLKDIPRLPSSAQTHSS